MTPWPLLLRRVSGKRLRNLIVAALMIMGGTASAQTDNSVTTTTQPPGFSLEKLQTFSVAPSSSMVYGIDPDTLTIGADGVVRYVVVARSTSGALNVFYEGIRCQKGEVIVYANWDRDSAWSPSKEPQWRALSTMSRTRHSYRLARDAICDGPTLNGNTANMLRALKLGKTTFYDE